MPDDDTTMLRSRGTSGRRRAGYAAAVLGVLLLVGALLVPWTVAGSASAAVAAGTTAGCGKNPTLTSGSHTINSGGQNRSYILSLPANYSSSRAYRLIFGWHWLNGTANDVATGGSDGATWAFYGQKQLSNNSAIFVAPQGIDNGWANTGGRDLTLFDNLTTLVENDLCVDTSQVFSMGWSYGGAMSYAVACARPNVVRAVVVYSGANLSGCNGGTQPVAYFGIHGTHDSVLNISNGRSLRDTFVRNNGCAAQNPAEPAQGSLRHITTAYSGCRSGYPVQWAAFDGDHTPSPVDGSTATSGTRTWTSAEAWAFLSQFSSTSSPSPSTSTSPSTSPSTSTSTSPSTSPSGSTTPATGTCAASATVNAWNTGLTENITITNRGSSTITGWRLVFSLPAGQTITGGWNASYSPASGTVTATNLSYNGTLAAGASTTIGFQATHTGNTGAATSFSLNGAACG
jgi:poly(3-hydroxybutyrate) depolymerase